MNRLPDARTRLLARAVLLSALFSAAAGRADDRFYPWSDAVRPGDWPLPRGDLSNTAGARFPSAEPSQGWRFTIDRPLSGYLPGMTVWSSPALGEVDGRVVLAVGSYDRHVYLLDARTGERLWRYTTGAGVYSTPLLWRDPDTGEAWIFAASSDRLLYGLDARTGARRYSAAVDPTLPTTGGAFLSGPCLGLVGGQPAVFVGHWVFDKTLTQSTQQGGLSAFEARTGRRLWRTDFQDDRVSDPLFAVVGGEGLVFAASRDGNLRALAADTGLVRWIHREAGPIQGGVLFARRSPQDRVLFGSNASRLVALEARTGEVVWTHAVGHAVAGAPALLPDGRVVFGGTDRHLTVLDAETGRLSFRLLLSGPVYSAPAVALLPNAAQILFAAWDHALHCAADDGRLLWSVGLGAPLWDAILQGESSWSSPVVAQLGGSSVVYHGSYAGPLVAIPLAQAPLSQGSGPLSPLRFLGQMLAVMLGTAALALWLTWRRRRSRAAPR